MFFRDKDGKVVVGQKPNIFIIVWAVCSILNLCSYNRAVSKTLFITGTLSLVIWAVLEVGWGASYFRRTLGTLVLVVVVLGILW